MIYQVSDLAYVQDIESLDKKINALAEISHNNDVNMTSIQDTYTVDEVNEALSNYALKEELNDFVLKSDYDILSDKVITLENDNATLKSQTESLTTQLNELINNVYTKTETDEKYLNKEAIINEMVTSQTDIEVLGNAKTSFMFINIEIEDLQNGFVFSYYDVADQTLTLRNKSYKFNNFTGDRYIYLNEEETIGFIITDNFTTGTDKEGNTHPT